MPAARLALVDGKPADAPPVIGADVLRVVIGDPQALVRGGFRALLEAHGGISVVGEAGDCDGVLALARSASPDVLLIDLDLPGAGALEATRSVVADRALANTRVVILAAGPSDERIFRALRAGVSGFLLKDAPAGDLVDALRLVAQGEAALSPSVARRVVEEVASLPDPCRPSPEDLDELTPRQREVVALVAGGLSNHEIAERLVVTPATAKTHVGRAIRALAARDRAQLVTIAYESGLVVPGPQRRTPTGVPIGAVA